MAHILLAEDDVSMRGFLATALRKAGHEVVEAEDGLAALAFVKEQGESFDLLLADIVMPGMDGIELSRQAAELLPQLKVMFITGFAAVAMNEAKTHALPTPTRVLSKPFHLRDLVDQVNQLLAA